MITKLVRLFVSPLEFIGVVSLMMLYRPMFQPLMRNQSQEVGIGRHLVNKLQLMVRAVNLSEQAFQETDPTQARKKAGEALQAMDVVSKVEPEYKTRPIIVKTMGRLKSLFGEIN